MFKKYSDIDFEWLKKNNNKIHFFGLGFIQVKINEEYRLHFYSPELEAFVDSPHNHKYNFESHILKGNIINKIYNVIPGNTHFLTEDSCQAGYIPNIPPKLISFELSSSNTYYQGESYKMDHRDFHIVEAHQCITLLKRGKYKKDLAEVSYEAKQNKVCPFSKEVKETELWDIIERLLKS